MTVDNALLPRDGWAGFRAERVGYWKRRRNQPIRAHEERVTSVTAFMHPSDKALPAAPRRGRWDTRASRQPSAQAPGRCHARRPRASPTARGAQARGREGGTTGLTGPEPLPLPPGAATGQAGRHRDAPHTASARRCVDAVTDTRVSHGARGGRVADSPSRGALRTGRATGARNARRHRPSYSVCPPNPPGTWARRTNARPRRQRPREAGAFSPAAAGSGRTRRCAWRSAFPRSLPARVGCTRPVGPRPRAADESRAARGA